MPEKKEIHVAFDQGADAVQIQLMASAYAEPINEPEITEKVIEQEVKKAIKDPIIEKSAPEPVVSKKEPPLPRRLPKQLNKHQSLRHLSLKHLSKIAPYLRSLKSKIQKQNRLLLRKNQPQQKMLILPKLLFPKRLLLKNPFLKPRLRNRNQRLQSQVTRSLSIKQSLLWMILHKWPRFHSQRNNPNLSANQPLAQNPPR
ncbi:hypothetical protein [Vibrio mexicanus]|uniref:hypothetical protein n=1 Tax=Vibrio mexicanus TaxID=1004326 RepID=UPI00069A10AC|nr:hypothetical protein [Vibrio mexicanus]